MRELRVPGDKSISHRALILAALAQGTSRLRGVLPAGDPRSTAAALRALGVGVPDPDGGELIIRAAGQRSWREPDGTLDCGNSGTTARLLLGALSGMPLRARLDGDASLRSRPMRRVSVPLRAMGATIDEEGDDGRLPLVVRGGALRDYEHASPVASAQVKSALLLAGVCAGARIAVTESMRSRDHTERMLATMGATVRSRADATGARIALEPPDRLQPLDLDVPGDFSSAAFLIAHALLAREPLVIRDVGVNETRTGLLAVLERMGARLRLEGRREQSGEPVADIVVEPATLRGTTVAAAEIAALIDEVPVLAVIALGADGETRVEGAAELRVKESDRISAIVGNIRRLGGDAEELRDGLVIAGSRKPLRGSVRAHGDHRIAMAFAVLARARGPGIQIDEPDTSAISFPGFDALLASLDADRPAR